MAPNLCRTTITGRSGAPRRIGFFTDAPEDEGNNLRQAGLIQAMHIQGGTVLPFLLIPPASQERSNHGPCNEAGLLEALAALGVR